MKTRDHGHYKRYRMKNHPASQRSERATVKINRAEYRAPEKDEAANGGGL